nr:beta-1,3-galactosyltransferase 1-like [Leptinotarsa decemlineata]
MNTKTCLILINDAEQKLKKYVAHKTSMNMVQAKLKYLIITTIAISAVSVLYLYSSTQEEVYIKIIDNVEYQKKEQAQHSQSEKLFDIDNFHYIQHNSNTCKGDTSIKAIFLVTSYFGNVETRSAMRRAFSSEDLKHLNFRRVFLLGRAPSDKYTSQKSVADEGQRFGDLIQGNFIEAYKNLTYKHVMGLKWASKFCSSAKYIVKMDDDIVVNIEKVTEILDSLKMPSRKNVIAGYILRNMQPIREPANKWYVTAEEYNSSSYPPFVSGWFYVTTPETAANLVKLSKTNKYFWIDDTYVTGILANQLKIRHFDIGKYFAVHSEYMECCLDDIRIRNLKCDYLIGPNGGNNNLFYEFNNAVSICNLNLCKDRMRPLNETCVSKKVHSLGKGKASIRNYKLH